MYLAKVGLHLRFGRTPESDAWVQNSGYAKALDDPNLLAGAPGLKSLRLFIGEGDQQWRNRDPIGFADQMIGVAHNSAIILEPTNECGDDDVLNYLAWLTAFTSHAHQRGYRVAGFSFAEGHPADLNVWVTIGQHGFAGVDYLAQHNYWFTNGTDFDQYHALRHELANQVLASHGFGSHPPWLLTEVGQQPGWQHSMSAEQAAAQIVAYNNHLAGDGTVAGAAVYTRGGCGGNPSFCDFETDPIAHVLWGAGGGGGGGGDPCAGVVCASPSYCVQGSCFCPDPYVWIDGVCQLPGGGGGVVGDLDVGAVVGAALVGGVIAGTALFVRRQIRHPTHVRTVGVLDRPRTPLGGR